MNTRIERTTGIVLATSLVSETSMAVQWMTSDYGRISTLVKGALRPKSGFIGQIDLFYECELLFYPRQATGLHLAREITSLKRRDRFRKDYCSTAMASYFSFAAGKSSLQDVPGASVFRLLQFILDFMEEAGPVQNAIHWTELKLLAMQGLAPQLNQCVRCGAPIETGNGRINLSVSGGGAVCTPCLARGGTGSIQVGPDILALLQSWQKADSPRGAIQTRCTTGQHAIVNSLLGQLLAYHLDIPPRTRDLAFQLMNGVIGNA